MSSPLKLLKWHKHIETPTSTSVLLRQTVKTPWSKELKQTSLKKNCCLKREVVAPTDF